MNNIDLANNITPLSIPELTVSEFSAAIKKIIETNFSYIKIKGEVSGLKRASSGHIYFNLKDNNAILACTCWKYNAPRIGVNLEEGIEIVVTGKITTYPGNSRYQMNVEYAEVAGIGALMQLLEKRKKLFAQEGLFNQDRKKPLPFLPQRIGVITSISGSVIRDILHRIEDRFPIHVIIWPVSVQGNNSSNEITAALNGFNDYQELKLPPVDLIILARGGGSIEDLWSFNEENVVRAIAASKIPIISAVGHETDFTLADFVADRRAPTPTAAAEFAVPVHSQILYTIAEYSQRLTGSIYKTLDYYKANFKALLPTLGDPNILLQNHQQKIDESIMRIENNVPKILSYKNSILQQISARLNYLRLVEELNRNVSNVQNLHQHLVRNLNLSITQLKNQLQSKTLLLESLNYKKVLKRGFAIIHEANSNKIITNSIDATKHDKLDIEFYDGRISLKQK